MVYVWLKFVGPTFDLAVKWLESGASDHNSHKTSMSAYSLVHKEETALLKTVDSGYFSTESPNCECALPLPLIILPACCCYIWTSEGMDTMGTDSQRWSGLLTVELRLCEM